MGREVRRIGNYLSSSHLLYFGFCLACLLFLRLLYVVDLQRAKEPITIEEERKKEKTQKKEQLSSNPSLLGPKGDEIKGSEVDYDLKFGERGAGAVRDRSSDSRSSSARMSINDALQDKDSSVTGNSHYNGEHFILSLSDDEFQTLTFDQLMAPYGESDGGPSCSGDFGNQLVNRWRDAKKEYCQR